MGVQGVFAPLKKNCPSHAAPDTWVYRASLHLGVELVLVDSSPPPISHVTASDDMGCGEPHRLTGLHREGDEVDVGHLYPPPLILRYTTSGENPIFSDIEINP